MDFPCSSYASVLRLIDVQDPTGSEVWPLQAMINNFGAPNYMPIEWFNASNFNQFRLESITNVQYDENDNPISADVVWWPFPFNTSLKSEKS
jgi:hypothetical protein